MDRGTMRKLNAMLLVCLELIFASTVRAQSGTNTAEMNGDYTFSLNGITGNSGGTSSAYAAVGRFTADGAGNLSNGQLDANGLGSGAALTAQAFTGTYTIGADHRGVMNLVIGSSSKTLAFVMLANGNADFVEADAAGGSGTISSGTMEKADTAAYSTARITGDYAFGAAGLDNGNNRAALAGRFTSNGAGSLTNAAADVNAYGTVVSLSITAANYAVADTATGRGTMSLAFTINGSPGNLNFVFYVVNAGKLFTMESDTVSSATPLLSGVVQQQQTPTGGFSAASLNDMVIYMTGFDGCSTGTGSDVVAGLLTTDGSSAASVTYDEGFCGTGDPNLNLTGTYSVTSNGRTLMTLGGIEVIAYLVNTNEAMLFNGNSTELFGFGEPHAAGSFTNSSVSGAYGGFTMSPVTFGVIPFAGEFDADGASPTGSITGTEDTGGASGASSGVASRATYTVSPSPTNGRGSMTAASGLGGNASLYVISATKFVAVSMSDANPAVMVFERSPAPAATVSLATLTQNPTSVIGGSQSSTGTVTLSGSAPAGGVQVVLSSSNPGAAQVPSSVTVPAGATTATFTVTTSAVASSTWVSISASFGGVTKTATLSVNPVPRPTVSSLTLNPSSVIGGLQSSTGTVTLSGPAPAGGAQVALSSSNPGAAQVPSSITVPAGATSASFTVRTSIVLLSTSANVSASYNNSTRTATLSVLL